MDLNETFQAALSSHRAGDLSAAEAGYRLVLARALDRRVLHNLGVLLEGQGRLEEAELAYRQLAELAPDRPEAIAPLAHLLRFMRRLEEAEAVYRRVLELAPDAPTGHVDLALAILGQGRLEEGFRQYEGRPLRRRLLGQGLPLSEWQGETLAGKRLAVWREQGYGDQIMMARFLPQLAGMGAEVTYIGVPGLERFFGQLPIRYLNDSDTDLSRIPGQDFWVGSMSLPHRLGASLRSLPAAPYLSAQPRQGLGRIGVAWRGQPQNPNDRHRSLPEAEARRLLSRPGAISLHPEDTGAADFQDTAEIVAGLDLVISIDTSLAHLAGAMGKPVWVLVAAHALDWQWLRAREDSPWYPSARILRQTKPGDWTGLVDRVEAELAGL